MLQLLLMMTVAVQHPLLMTRGSNTVVVAAVAAAETWSGVQWASVDADVESATGHSNYQKMTPVTAIMTTGMNFD